MTSHELPLGSVADLVARALHEDLAGGDLTTEACIDADAMARASAVVSCVGDGRVWRCSNTRLYQGAGRNRYVLLPSPERPVKVTVVGLAAVLGPTATSAARAEVQLLDPAATTRTVNPLAGGRAAYSDTSL